MAATATATGRRAALTFRRLFSSHSAAPAPPPLLGHFHHPAPVPPRGCPPRPHTLLTVPAFQPLITAASSSPRRLSLDFVPDLSHFVLLYSHLGLLLLRHRERHDAFLVCDPVSRRHVLFHPPPVDEYSSGGIFSAALLSRDDAAAGDPGGDGGGLRFGAVCVAVNLGRPCAWVGTYRDGECLWISRGRHRVRPRLAGVPHRARRGEPVLAHPQQLLDARAGHRHAAVLLPAGAGGDVGLDLPPQVPRRGDAGVGRAAVRRLAGAAGAAGALGAGERRMQRPRVGDGEARAHAGGARRGSMAAKKRPAPALGPLAERHRRWPHRQGVHRHRWIRALLVPSGHRRDGVLGNRRRHGVRPTHIPLHLGYSRWLNFSGWWIGGRR
ncbi:uncharacterized protein [Oryza sativa Japonica Group]|uniref:uncharacterized protein n=1 Tax=Oryza sativa subsp. japonica TaxID=39947 RepID=UPI00339C73ED